MFPAWLLMLSMLYVPLLHVLHLLLSQWLLILPVRLPVLSMQRVLLVRALHIQCRLLFQSTLELIRSRSC